MKAKDLVMMPARLAIALQEDGWWLRSEIIWHKPNPMPESITDRPTSAHEKVYLLTKRAKYFYDADAVREDSITGDHPKRNCRNVWKIATRAYPEAHFATFPLALVEPCLKAGTAEKGCCPECGAPWVREVATGWKVSCNCPVDHWTKEPQRSMPCTVMDPFAGAGTVGVVCQALGLRFIGIELQPDYIKLAIERLNRGPGRAAKALKRVRKDSL